MANINRELWNRDKEGSIVKELQIIGYEKMLDVSIRLLKLFT